MTFHVKRNALLEVARVPTPGMLDALLAHWPALAVGAFLTIRVYTRRARPMRVVTVIDGDTLMTVDRSGKRRTLRLADIDAPELSQRNGREARGFIEEAVGKQWVTVQLIGRDKYRRHLARIRIGNQDLAATLVRAGLAYSLKGFGFAGLSARLARRGVHSGFGQRKPWQAGSRSSWLGRVLARRRARRR